MPQIYEIEATDIERLSDVQLTSLLLRLLHLEANLYNIPLSCIGGSLNITVGDRGEDAHIKWEGEPSHTNWIPNCNTLFQCKATDMPPAECKKEICKKNSNQLKERVEEVLEAGGSYLLFHNRPCNEAMIGDRIAKFREALKEAGKDYADTANIQIYDSQKISDWVNQNISCIAFVSEIIGRYLPDGLLTWPQWAGYPENQIRYIDDETLKGFIQQLRIHFIGTGKKVARVVGLSGLGKTRLAFEAFRPPEDPNIDFIQQSLCDQVVYINAGANSHGLSNRVSQWRTQNLSGIIIVDNCGTELHRQLQAEVEHVDSKLSLLTLDYSSERLQVNHPVIEFKPVSDEVIKGILTEAYPGLRDQDIGRIVDFAQGFPKMAVLMAQARLNDEPDIGNIQEDVLVQKMLWGRRDVDHEALMVISACALFDKLGFDDEVAEQRNFVADKICKINREKFYSKAYNFVEIGILDKRHRYVRVVPRPLAIRLSSDWWKRYPPEQAKSLFIEEMPPGMIEALCDQLSKLHFLPEAKNITYELCGEQAPFGQAEVLNSEKGSRLFCSLVEVNPEATVDTLERVFGHWNTEQLLQVGPGRHYIIRALSKLCFWEKTFPKAARLMMAFAAAENESWANNATNLFLELFHIYLSGTQAPPQLRIALIDEAINSSNHLYRTLSIKALGHSLKGAHFMRMGGVETQGSRAPQEDWTPKIWGEIFDYWRDSLRYLIPIASGNDGLAQLAREQIVNNLRDLINYGRMEEIEFALTEIGKKRSYYWPEAFKELKNALSYVGEMIPAEGRTQLLKWIEMLRPKSINEKLESLVSKPAWSHEKDESGKFTDIAARDASTFANECIENLSHLLENLSIIFEGEQRQGYIFGFTLGENLDQPDIFIKEALAVLAKIPSERANSIVLGGFLAAIKDKYPELVEITLDKVVSDDALYTHAMNLTRLCKPNRKDLERLMELLRIGKINVNDSRMLAYGSVLSHVSPETVIWFCDELLNLSSEAIPSALEILFFYCFDEPEKFKICSKEFHKILLTHGLFNSKYYADLDTYHWQEIAKNLLNIEKGDNELAHHIAKEIISSCEVERLSYNFEGALIPVIRILLSKYRNIVWPIFSEGLLSSDEMTRFCLIQLFKHEVKYLEPESSVISELSEDFLIEWCKQNDQIAPIIIPQILTVAVKDDESIDWHPIIKFLIDTYGDRSEVLSNVSFNIGPTSWWGSNIPHLNQRIELFKKLIHHKRPEVRYWAINSIEHLTKEIQREKRREEEHEYGIYY